MPTYMLLAANDSAARHYVEDAAGRLGFPCRVVARGAALDTNFGQSNGGKPALILLDLDLPDVDTFTLLRQVQEADAAPIIVLASQRSAPLAKRALREGASDYLMKPLTAERIEISMRNALKISGLEEEVARLKRQTDGKLAWGDIIAISPEMQRALNLAKRAAELDIPVLIEGESGSGRQLIARAIHAASSRTGQRLISLDRREHASPGRKSDDTLLDALWTEAEGGTVFIQEIGELGPRDQERLAQLLNRRGKGGADGRSGNVRLICSSSADLIERVKSKQFREDLYYLINVFPIWIPPLRDRPDDLPHLAWHYLARFAAEEGKRIQSIDGEALALLRSYSWPGNVLQLENAIYRAVILSEGDQLRVDDLPQIVAQMRGLPTLAPRASQPAAKEPYRGPAMFGSPLAIASPAPYLPPSGPIGIPVLTQEGEIRTLTEIEADLIKLALGHYRGHITEAARRLGIGRSTLYRKMREFGLDMRHNSV
jgi:DNA-binding NtrC family response regulator